MKKIITGIVIVVVVIALALIGKTLYDQNNTVVATSNNITLEKSTTITQDGTYTITGTLKSGQLTINTSGNVTLILDGVNITNNNGPAIYIKKAKNVTITLKDGTTSTLTDNGSSKYDGVIYSVCDLTINGEGNLNITANNKDGIATKDDLVIDSGTIRIDSVDDGIRGRDSITINGGNITINSTGDGLKTTNDENTEKGDITINGGDIRIVSKKDGIQAIKNIVITNGDISITTGNEGSTKSGKEDFGRTQETVTDEDSLKAIKASGTIEISNGNFTIDSEDDGIHSNTSIKITGGVFNITSGDDGVHADELIEIAGGEITIDGYEGLEATVVKVSDGTIKIDASDDGINATAKSDKYTPTVEIEGGNITINMGQGDTDAVDSNGNIYIKGGSLNITANSPFDYDGEGKYTGGTLIVNGSETTELTNQMMGGGMRQGGNMRGQGGRW